MRIIVEQQPDVIFMAPVCAPWSAWSNMKPAHKRKADRDAHLPMVKFCAAVAEHQIAKGRLFMIENPASSAMWNTGCFNRTITHYNKSSHAQACSAPPTWDTLHMCAYGMRDPVSHKYYYKPTTLYHNFPEGTVAPLFSTVPQPMWQQTLPHTHEQLTGYAIGYGNRTSLA